MSPFIQFFIRVMHIMYCNNIIIQCSLFHCSMWKTHCLILIFFTCPLVLPASSVTNTRFSLSIFSMPFTILFYIVIRCPRSLLSCKVGSPIPFSLSSYVKSFSSGTIFVAIFWILSNLLISFFKLADHTTAAYCNFGCIRCPRSFPL
ncbi:hypothetical protein E2C01_072104 [Portunus trituberculatus]|uniref:Uncharacterized protein n=1 Tax=Portunus trituberculatus TaxID=210409 RepID=A0A5B7I6A3_PORTR|nr:hypothetical protein [Portunus trituberculatus]